jgi:uncharacterized protein (DUF2164 family)
VAEIRFSEDEKTQIVHRIQRYFDQELRQEIGRFDAEFLLDFFSREVGAYFYNRGLTDAQAVLAGKVDELGEAIYALEKPTDLRR